MCVLLASLVVIAFNVLFLLLGEALTCGLVPKRRGKGVPYFFSSILHSLA